MIVNLTPHIVRGLDVDGNVHEFEPSGSVATVATSTERVGLLIDGGLKFATSRRTFGQVKGLPGQQAGTAFLVSAMVKDRTPVRFDVFAPDTGPTAIRKEGQVWAVRGLIR